MKKLILFLTLSLGAFNSFANANTGNFYLIGHIGTNKFDKVSYNLVKTVAKHKSKPAFHLSAGVGYHFNDILRADVAFDYTTVHFSKSAYTTNTHTNTWARTLGGSTNGFKTHIHSVMLNGYVDLFKYKNFSVFAGPSIGYARIAEDQEFVINTVNGTGSTKMSHNLAYGAHAGIGYKMNENITAELKYSWKYYGKSTPQRTNGALDTKANTYKGSHLLAGLRFNI